MKIIGHAHAPNFTSELAAIARSSMLPFLFLSLFAIVSTSQAPANASVDVTLKSTPDISRGQSSRGDLASPLSVLIVASFFSGHIIPLLAVGEELLTRGHNVSFMTTKVSGSRLIPDVLNEIGLNFISAGPDPRTRSQYEEAIYGLMGKGFLHETQVIATFARDHTFSLRVACDRLNLSSWDIIIADSFLSNLVRYIDLKWGNKIILSTAVAGDYPSIAALWSSPSVNCFSCSEDMGLMQRTLNAIFYKNPLVLYARIEWEKRFVAGNDSMMKKYFIEDAFSHFRNDEFHPSLVYSAVGVEYSRPAYPGVHMVGPVLRSKFTQLDPGLVEWLSRNTERGVVYISMGTTALVTQRMAESFIDGVLETKYSVLWSLRESNMIALKGIVKNSSRFYISNWVPQVSVFRHDAVKVGIIHCGTGGVHEALYFGVPVICIPFWFDQFSWANRIRDQGLGLVLYADEISPEKVTSSLKMLESKGFRERVWRISEILKEAGGSKRAADLVEFYATVGYDHLIPSYVKYRWPWIKYYDVDVYICVLFVCIIPIVLFKLFCNHCGSCWLKQKND